MIKISATELWSENQNLMFDPKYSNRTHLNLDHQATWMFNLYRPQLLNIMIAVAVSSVDCEWTTSRIPYSIWQE